MHDTLLDITVEMPYSTLLKQYQDLFLIQLPMRRDYAQTLKRFGFCAVFDPATYASRLRSDAKAFWVLRRF